LHWTDEHGDWVRQTFVSPARQRVVQWLTPRGSDGHVRIALQKSAGSGAWFTGMDWGSHLEFTPRRPTGGIHLGGRIAPQLSPPKGSEAGTMSGQLSEQRRIYKCILDPSWDQKRLRPGGVRACATADRPL